MFDAQLRSWLDPLLGRMGKAISATGLGANAITITGGLLAPVIGYALSQQCWGVALGLIVLNRLLDGLDGAVARIRGTTLWGGYLDSLCDYLFYLAVPLGFALADPENRLPALLLIATFVLTAVSFLALAAILAGRDMGHKDKAFTYTSGLMEGGETIVFFIAFCLLPLHFGALAMVFAGLCVLTVVQRLWLAQRILR
jgi:phosphatidylglycerophosphate synthase